MVGLNAVQRTTARLSGVLKDELGNGVGIPVVNAVTLTLYDRASRDILNGRDHINILNVNGGALDSSGNFAFTLTPGDNVIVNSTEDFEIHCALIEFGYSTGKEGHLLLQFAVANLGLDDNFVPTPAALLPNIYKARLKVNPSADAVTSEHVYTNTLTAPLVFAANVGAHPFISFTSTVDLERVFVASLHIIKTALDPTQLSPVRHMIMYWPSPTINLIMLFDSAWAPYTLQGSDTSFHIDMEIHVYAAG